MWSAALWRCIDAELAAWSAAAVCSCTNATATWIFSTWHTASTHAIWTTATSHGERTFHMWTTGHCASSHLFSGFLCKLLSLLILSVYCSSSICMDSCFQHAVWWLQSTCSCSALLTKLLGKYAWRMSLQLSYTVQLSGSSFCQSWIQICICVLLILMASSHRRQDETVLSCRCSRCELNWPQVKTFEFWKSFVQSRNAVWTESCLVLTQFTIRSMVTYCDVIFAN